MMVSVYVSPVSSKKNLHSSHSNLALFVHLNMLSLRNRTSHLAESAKRKIKLEGWVTEKHSSPYSESDIWTNKDSDVTPLEQRTWTTWTMLGFWISDSLSAQGWEGAASIIAVGLTW